VYWALARETYGDVYSSSALSIAFRDKLLELESLEVERVRQIDELLSFNENNLTKHFFKAFDNMCRRSLLNTIVQMRDFNASVIPPKCFDVYVAQASSALPTRRPL